MNEEEVIELDAAYGKKQSKDNFRLNNMRIALTYNSGHIDKSEYRRWFKNSIAETKVLEIAHERGSKTQRDHTHVLIDFGKKLDTRSSKKFDYEGAHPNIRKVTTEKHWDNWIRYLKKQDPDNKELKTKRTIIDKVWDCDGLKAALDKNAKSLSDVNAIISLYGLKPLKSARVIDPNRTWQKEVLRRLDEEPHPRRIVWVYDKYGDSGKSALCKYLMVTDPESCYVVNQMGGMSNFATIIQTAMQSRWNGKVMLIDLARDSQEKAIYEPLESLKNGVVTATKYRGSTMVFDNPHVVVFANFEPDYKRVSVDRWAESVIVIDEDHDNFEIENGDRGVDDRDEKINNSLKKMSKHESEASDEDDDQIEVLRKENKKLKRMIKKLKEKASNEAEQGDSAENSLKATDRENQEMMKKMEDDREILERKFLTVSDVAEKLLDEKNDMMKKMLQMEQDLKDNSHDLEMLRVENEEIKNQSERRKASLIRVRKNKNDLSDKLQMLKETMKDNNAVVRQAYDVRAKEESEKNDSREEEEEKNKNRLGEKNADRRSTSKNVSIYVSPAPTPRNSNMDDERRRHLQSKMNSRQSND